MNIIPRDSRFLLLSVVTITLLTLPQTSIAQKNYFWPPPNPSVPLDTLHFEHPQVGERAVKIINELIKLEKKVSDRYKDNITFDHEGTEFHYWSISEERLTPQEYDSLCQIALEPIEYKDSSFSFLSFECLNTGTGPFVIFRYNEAIGGNYLIQPGPRQEDRKKNYMLYGESKDTVYLAEWYGYLISYPTPNIDTLIAENELVIETRISDPQKVTVEGLPEDGYCISLQFFSDEGARFEVSFSYQIVSSKTDEP